MIGGLILLLPMSIPSLNLPQNTHDQPLASLPPSLEQVLFAPLRAALEGSDFTRGCCVIDDLSFATLCVRRVLQSSKSGRDFIQTHGIPNQPGLSRSNYFGSLSSPRRLKMMSSLLEAMRIECLPNLRAHDDLLAVIPELKGWEVWAMDGHAIAHATHDSRNAKNIYTPVSAIYKLDLRTGWAGFVDLVRPTERSLEHEITTLKRQDTKQLRCGAAKGSSTLIVYDAAVVDFQFAYNLKQSKSIYVITQWKENFVPMTAIPQPIDGTNPVNALILKDEMIYFNNTPGAWRRITAVCPDKNQEFVTLSNEMTLPPGALNQCRRLRWNIEKAYDQQEQKLDEHKAWTAHETGKRIQVIAICMAHNLLKLFGAKLKSENRIEDTKVIRAWHKELEKRVIAARKIGHELPQKLYKALYRPTEVSLQFIRWLRSALIYRTSFKQSLEGLRPCMEAYI
jgi:hypothetical protein